MKSDSQLQNQNRALLRTLSLTRPGLSDDCHSAHQLLFRDWAHALAAAHARIDLHKQLCLTLVFNGWGTPRTLDFARETAKENCSFPLTISRQPHTPRPPDVPLETPGDFGMRAFLPVELCATQPHPLQLHACVGSIAPQMQTPWWHPRPTERHAQVEGHLSPLPSVSHLPQLAHPHPNPAQDVARRALPLLCTLATALSTAHMLRGGNLPVRMAMFASCNKLAHSLDVNKSNL